MYTVVCTLIAGDYPCPAASASCWALTKRGRSCRQATTVNWSKDSLSPYLRKTGKPKSCIGVCCTINAYWIAYLSGNKISACGIKQVELEHPSVAAMFESSPLGMSILARRHKLHTSIKLLCIVCSQAAWQQGDLRMYVHTHTQHKVVNGIAGCR